MVPTVDRDVRTGLVWSMAIAGGMPSMRRPGGGPCDRIAAHRARRFRRSGAAPRRTSVSKTNEDFPEPLTPVTTINSLMRDNQGRILPRATYIV